MVQATRKCSIDGCEKGGRLRRGWCDKHYWRWLTHGDPLKLKEPKDPKESFAEKTSWHGKCLLWTGARTNNGYGRLGIRGKFFLAHRYAWQAKNGQIPEGKWIDHTCHNRLCVNVEHLRLATHSENLANRSGPIANSSTKIRNVYKEDTGWRVQIRKNGKAHYFGIYPSIEEAAKVAERERGNLFGEFAGKG